MKSWLRLLIFVMAFQMEVRVKASSANLLQSPEGCLNSQETCIVKVTEKPLHLINEKFALHAAPETVLERQPLTGWKLMKGTLWVEKGKGLFFETPFATVKASKGEYWIVSQEDKVWIRNMSADLQVVLRDGRQVEAPPGFQFWVGGFNSAAATEYGMIEPIPMKDQITLWYPLFRGSKEQFAARLHHFREDWGDLVEKSSLIYKDQVIRKVAAIEESKQRVLEGQRREQAKRARIRELFRSRVFDR